MEPPVPPGLGTLSAAIEAFADFMRIDADLIAVAAQRSANGVEVEGLSDELRQWIHDLAESEKDTILLRLVDGSDVHLRSKLLRRFHEERATPAATAKDAEEGSRTVAELLASAERYGEVRRREEAKREARERARRQREEAEARA
ncbi:MAG: hypothetical protein HY675_23440, partial [Chloroflexi bacterium]|nr:hypothetical protein [Chloroflexota bacterium]